MSEPERPARPLVMIERAKPWVDRNWKLCSFMGPECFRCAGGPCEAPEEAKIGSPLRTWLRAERARGNAAYLREDISPELYPLELDRTRFSPPVPNLVELSAFATRAGVAVQDRVLEAIFPMKSPSPADFDAWAAANPSTERPIFTTAIRFDQPEDDGDVTVWPKIPA